MKTIKKVLYIIFAIIGFIVFLGIKELYREKNKEKAEAITNQIFKTVPEIPISKEYIIGSSNFRIKSPYPLKVSSLEIQELYKERIDKMEVFEFLENPNFKGKVTYFKWISSVRYDLDAGLDGSLDNIRKLPGVEKVVDDRKYFENLKYQAYIYDAIMLRDGKSLLLKGAIFKSGQETWTFIIEPIGSKNEAIVDTLLKSLMDNK